MGIKPLPALTLSDKSCVDKVYLKRQSAGGTGGSSLALLQIAVLYVPVFLCVSES